MTTESPSAPLSTWGVLWRIRLSALYHLKRERFLDGADKASKAVSALGGAAAFSQLKDNASFGLWVVGCGFYNCSFHTFSCVRRIGKGQKTCGTSQRFQTYRVRGAGGGIEAYSSSDK